MPGVDPFTDYYEPLLDTTYDCADRIVLNAYFQFAQSGGGFRMWWNQLHDTEDNLDDTHLMRMAGRFARRVWASAKRQGIFITKCDSDERMHELAAEHRPTDPQFQGVFCILVKRAPAPVREVLRNANGGFHVQKATVHAGFLIGFSLDSEATMRDNVGPWRRPWPFKVACSQPMIFGSSERSLRTILRGIAPACPSISASSGTGATPRAT